MLQASQIGIHGYFESLPTLITPEMPFPSLIIWAIRRPSFDAFFIVHQGIPLPVSRLRDCAPWHLGDTSAQALSSLNANISLFQNISIEPLLGDTVEYRSPPPPFPTFICSFVFLSFSCPWSPTAWEPVIDGSSEESSEGLYQASHQTIYEIHHI